MAKDSLDNIQKVKACMEAAGLVFTTDHTDLPGSRAHATLGGKTQLRYYTAARDGGNGIQLLFTKDSEELARITGALHKRVRKSTEKIRPHRVVIKPEELEAAIAVLKENPKNLAENAPEEKVPGAGTEEVPGAGTEEAPVVDTEEVSGADTEDTAGTTEETSAPEPMEATLETTPASMEVTLETTPVKTAENESIFVDETEKPDEEYFDEGLFDDMEETDFEEDDAASLAGKVKKLVRQGNEDRIVIIRKEKELLSLPVNAGIACGAFGFALSPWILAAGVAAGIGLQCRVQIRKGEDSVRDGK